MATEHHDNDDDDVISFLVTTDNHLGYCEDDPRRAEDSFISFEECLMAATITHNVDAMLLAGDLFHENKPTLRTLTRTLTLFRQYVLGDRDIALSLLSDPKVNFPTHPTPCANFQDPNINVALPVFMIHGNHDDTFGGIGAIDVLASSGLVNYFGHVSTDDIILQPVLLRKGRTNIALYGMGSVRDERLHRCFTYGKVKIARPATDAEKWFSILLFHQNRGTRGGPGAKNGIDEAMLAPFQFDLIIWGNEHEQMMEPQAMAGATTEIIQPGSTVMTSMSGAEFNPKKYGVLRIRPDLRYKLDAFELKSVRPCVRRSIDLATTGTPKTLIAVEAYLQQQAEAMLAEAEAQARLIPPEYVRRHPDLVVPIMRLSVIFEDPFASAPFPQPNFNRFGLAFKETVANSRDMLKPAKPPAQPRGANHVRVDGHAANAPHGARGAMQEWVTHTGAGLTTDDIRAKIQAVFATNARDACQMLSEPELSEAVYSFVEKGEKAAIDDKIGELYNNACRAMYKSVRTMDPDAVNRETIAALAARHKADVNTKFYTKRNEDDPAVAAAAAAAARTGAAVLPAPPLPWQLSDDAPNNIGAVGGAAKAEAIDVEGGDDGDFGVGIGVGNNNNEDDDDELLFGAHALAARHVDDARRLRNDDFADNGAGAPSPVVRRAAAVAAAVVAAPAVAPPTGGGARAGAKRGRGAGAAAAFVVVDADAETAPPPAARRRRQAVEPPANNLAIPPLQMSTAAPETQATPDVKRAGMSGVCALWMGAGGT